MQMIGTKALIFTLLGGALAYGAVILAYSAGVRPDTGCKEILIAECISTPTNGPGVEIVRYVKPSVNVTEGAHPVEVEIVQSLKGNARPGRRLIGADYPMVPGRRYLLYRYVFDDDGGGPEAYAGLHYGVAELPTSTSAGELDGKSLHDQISLLYRQSVARMAGLPSVPD